MKESQQAGEKKTTGTEKVRKAEAEKRQARTKGMQQQHALMRWE
jgi:hypothetical protein